MRLGDLDALKEDLFIKFGNQLPNGLLEEIENAPTVKILPENVIEAHTKIGYERGFNDGYATCIEDMQIGGDD